MVKVINSEHDTTKFSNIKLEVVLLPFEDCIGAINNAQNLRPGTDNLLKPANDMAKSLLTELVKAKRELLRETMDRLGLHNEYLWALLKTIEDEIGPKTPLLAGLTDSIGVEQPAGKERDSTVEEKTSLLADLIDSLGQSTGEERDTAVAKLRAVKQSDPELFKSHMLHLSTPFQEFIAELLDGHNKKTAVDPPEVEGTDENTSDLPTSSLTRTDSRNSFSDLKARIDALKKRNNGDCD
jgi:hypothetical protein